MSILESLDEINDSMESLHISHQEWLQDLHEIFNDLENGVGLATSKGMGLVLRNLGMNPTEDEVNNLVNKLDLDGNGVIEFTEFLYCVLELLKDSEADVKEAFRVFDKTGSGLISASEIRLYLTNFGHTLSDDEVDELIKAAGDDNDGSDLLLNYPSLINVIMEEISEDSIMTGPYSVF